MVKLCIISPRLYHLFMCFTTQCVPCNAGELGSYLTEDSVFKSNLEGWVELLVKVLASFGAERSKIHMLRLGYAKEAA